MWYEIDIRKLFYIEFFLMKKIIILIFVLVGFININISVYSYSQDCLSELNSLNTWTSKYNNCKQDCLSDKLAGIEDDDVNCDTEICYNEKDNLWIAKDTYDKCKSSNSSSASNQQTNQWTHWWWQKCSSDSDCWAWWTCDIKPPLIEWTCSWITNPAWMINDWSKNCVSDKECESPYICIITPPLSEWKCGLDCDIKKQYTEWWVLKCCPWMVVKDDNDPTKNVCIVNNEWNAWINMNSGCLINWQCSYNIYKTLGIRKSDQNPKVSTFVQDIVLWVTMFLWTVISLVLIISGVLYILAGIQWNSSKADMAKKWIINSLLGLVLVTGSYALVRLIQFVATAWWW